MYNNTAFLLKRYTIKSVYYEPRVMLTYTHENHVYEQTLIF